MTVYYVDVTTGDNGDDGESEGNAWQTLAYAMDQIGDIDFVYVKASASYVVEDGSNDCILYIDDAGTRASWIFWEGYTTTPGDNGVVTLDANTNTLASCVISAIGGNVYHHFKNFRFTGGSGDGVDGNGTSDHELVFENCRFDNNDGDGLGAGQYCKTYNCVFDTNGGSGCEVTYNCGHYACVAFGNGDEGIYSSSPIMYQCLIYNNGAGNAAIRVNYANVAHAVIGCTIDKDGASAAGDRGIHVDHSEECGVAILNNIIFDCHVGIGADGDCEEAPIADFNLFYSNTTDRTNFKTGDNDVAGSGDPFTDSANRDYTLTAGSDAIDAGLDVSHTLTFWSLP